MREYQKHAGDDAKLLIKFHWPYFEFVVFPWVFLCDCPTRCLEGQVLPPMSFLISERLHEIFTTTKYVNNIQVARG